MNDEKIIELFFRRDEQAIRESMAANGTYCRTVAAGILQRPEDIELTFDPNNIVADGEDLFLCEWLCEDDQDALGERYRVNHVRNGVTTHLPIYSWFYQVLDGYVLYIQRDTYFLKSYELATGKVTTISENVFEFTVLEDRYICIVTFNDDPIIYDWQTGKKTVLDTHE